MPFNLKVQFDNESDKIKYVKKVDRIKERVDREKEKYDAIPTVFKTLPLLGAAGLAYLAFRSKFFKKHPEWGPISVGLTAAALPALISLSGEIGEHFATRAKAKVNKEYKKELLREALKYQGIKIIYKDTWIEVK